MLPTIEKKMREEKKIMLEKKCRDREEVAVDIFTEKYTGLFIYFQVLVLIIVRSALSAEYGSTRLVANPACSQLNKGKKKTPSLFTPNNFGLARQVRPSRPAPACSFSTLRLNRVLTHEIPPAFHDGVHLFITSTVIGSVLSSSGQIAYR